jgi:hypothetical protein
LRNGIETALISELLLRPGRSHNVETLVEAITALVKGNIESVVFALVVPPASREDDPAVAEEIEQSKFLSYPQGVITGEEHGGRG